MSLISVKKWPILSHDKVLTLTHEDQTLEMYNDKEHLYHAIWRVNFCLRVSLHEHVLRPVEHSKMAMHPLLDRIACRMHRHTWT